MGNGGGEWLWLSHSQLALLFHQKPLWKPGQDLGFGPSCPWNQFEASCTAAEKVKLKAEANDAPGKDGQQFLFIFAAGVRGRPLGGGSIIRKYYQVFPTPRSSHGILHTHCIRLAKPHTWPWVAVYFAQAI